MKAEGGFSPLFYEKLFGGNHEMDLLSLLLVNHYFPVSLHRSLIQYFEINLSSLPSDKINETDSMSYNYSALLEELISEFE